MISIPATSNLSRLNAGKIAPSKRACERAEGQNTYISATPSSFVPQTEPWFVYILECAGRRLYLGIAQDIAVRFQQHRAGTGAAFTRRYPPLKILWSEPHASFAAARQREAQWKRWSGIKKWALVGGDIQRLRHSAKSREHND